MICIFFSIFVYRIIIHDQPKIIIEINFYSNRNRINVVRIELERKGQTESEST